MSLPLDQEVPGEAFRATVGGGDWSLPKKSAVRFGGAAITKGPVIGITAGSEAGAEPFAELVRRSGGTPLLVLPDPEQSPEETLSHVGGLLVAGEEDIDSGPSSEELGLSDSWESSRGSVELALLEAALELDIPVLGVFRGMQLLNLALGGTLTGSVAGHGPSRKDGEEASSYHRIYIAPGSKLAAVVGSGGFVRVNSRHHLAIREAQKSPRLLASAYSLDDGVIEAVESPEHSWVIGVQFQPERRLEVPPHFDKLFQSLVRRANT